VSRKVSSCEGEVGHIGLAPERHRETQVKAALESRKVWRQYRQSRVAQVKASVSFPSWPRRVPGWRNGLRTAMSS
jgi:hypothetical protein